MQNTIALRNCVLIDGTGQEPRLASILIKGDLISSVSNANVVYPPDAKVIDLTGKTVLPGFINAHVHNAYNEENLKNWLYDGVMTVRDLILLTDQIDPFPFKDRVNTRNDLSRLIGTGYLVAAPNGYPLDIWKPPFLAVSTEDDARKHVSGLIDRGADLIKIPVEDGSFFFNEKRLTLSLDLIRAITESAHKNGTIVCAHVTNSRNLREALEGNVDDIAHMMGDVIPDELIDKMVRTHIYLEPTLELWQIGEKHLNIKPNAIDNLRNYVAAGGNVVLGSDYYGFPGIPFDMGMPMTEIKLMQSAGMTPMQIIVSSTRNAAVVCNKDHLFGTIEVGKKADLFAIQGNPLDDLDRLASDKLVIHNGAVVRDFGDSKAK
jgi:imidazolonepropionase-like amidohydrolase